MNKILKKLTCLFLSIFFCQFTYAQSIAGIWKGGLHARPKSIPIDIYIGRDSSGKLIATFNSPGQKCFKNEGMSNHFYYASGITGSTSFFNLSNDSCHPK